MLATTSLSTLLVLLLTSGLNIAVPDIRSGLAASSAGVGWVLSGYTLAFAMLSLTGGALADRYGARRIFLTGVGVFAVFCLLAAGAPSVTILVVATLGQGAAAALVLPAALSLIQLVYRSDTAKLQWAVGMWAGANAVGAAIGPVVCGALVAAMSWRSMFVAIAAAAAVSFFVAQKFLPANRKGAGKLDVVGQGVAVLALGVIAFLAHDWTHLSPALLFSGAVLAVALLVAFVWVERRVSAPMLPMSQLADRPFSANAAATIIGTAAFFGALYIVSIGLQDTLGLSPFIAGVALLPLAAGNMVAALCAGRLIGWLGLRGAMIAGHVFLIAPLCVIPFVFESYPLLAASLVVAGIGWGLLVPTTSAAGLARAQAGREGVASGVTSGGRELGAAFAAALLLPLGLNAGLAAAAVVGVVALAIVVVGVRKVESGASTAVMH